MEIPGSSGSCAAAKDGEMRDRCGCCLGLCWGEGTSGERQGQGHWGQGDQKGEAERKACMYLDSGWPALPLRPATPAVKPGHSPPLVCSVQPIRSPTQPRRSPPDQSYTPGLHPAGHGGQGHPSSTHRPPSSSGRQRLLFRGMGGGSLPELRLLQNVPSWPNV